MARQPSDLSNRISEIHAFKPVENEKSRSSERDWLTNKNQSVFSDSCLKDFLQNKRAEVIAVSIFEYDKEEEERKLREAEFEAGELCGIQKGIQLRDREIAQSLMKKGMTAAEIADILEVSENDVIKMQKSF